MRGDFNTVADGILQLMRSTGGKITKDQYTPLREGFIEMTNDPIPDPARDLLFDMIGDVAVILQRDHDNFLRLGASNILYIEASRVMDGERLEAERTELFRKGIDIPHVRGLIACLLYHASPPVMIGTLISINPTDGDGAI